MLAPLLGVALVTYFAYHAVQGDRGLLAWWQVHQQMEVAETTLAAVAAERQGLEHRIALLRPDNLDLDMLDEQTRRVFAFAQSDDYLIIPPRQ